MKTYLNNLPLLILQLLLVGSPAFLAAQKTCTYNGQAASMKDHQWSCIAEWPLYASNRLMLQGMDIWENTLVSLEHRGRANIYDFNGRDCVFKGSFPLASHDDNNHANVASFGTQKAHPDDPLPLLYVTRASGAKMYDGWARLVFVERIDPIHMKSELVQRICLDVPKEFMAGATQWAIDKEQQFIYTFSNSIYNKAPNNRHIIQKFRIPPYRGAQDSLVVLTSKDALEEYYVEDYYNQPFKPIVQGMKVYDGILYLPTGGGSEESPSVLYVWDLGTRSMRNAVDMQRELPYEFEDCAWYNGYFYIQVGPHKLFKINFH